MKYFSVFNTDTGDWEVVSTDNVGKGLPDGTENGDIPIWDNDEKQWKIEKLEETSEEVSYDNSTSGMTATNIQEAIDELANSAIQSDSNGYYIEV